MDSTSFNVSTYSLIVPDNSTSSSQLTCTNGKVSSSTLSLAVRTAIAAWNSASYWMAAIICPLLLVVGVVGNFYASAVLILLRRVQKNPAILTIIAIGVLDISVIALLTRIEEQYWKIAMQFLWAQSIFRLAPKLNLIFVETSKRRSV